MIQGEQDLGPPLRETLLGAFLLTQHLGYNLSGNLGLLFPGPPTEDMLSRAGLRGLPLAAMVHQCPGYPGL